MRPFPKNRAVEILKRANAELGCDPINLRGLDESTYRRWFSGACRPTPASAKQAARVLWLQIHEQEHEKVRKKVFQFIRQIVQKGRTEWDAEGFQGLFYRLAREDRLPAPPTAVSQTSASNSSAS